MKHRKYLLALGFVLSFCLSLAQQKPYPEPKFDRDKFMKSATSVARGDSLACRNIDANFTMPANANLERFAQTLNGVWLNENRRTVHGLVVETDTAFYIKMNGTKGEAILIDRNNLGERVMSAPFAANRYKKTSSPQSMTFVNCTYEFVDQYIKVTDAVPIAALASSTRVNLASDTSLSNAWAKLINAKYFDSATMTPAKYAEMPIASRRTLRAVLGDGQRIAVLPDGKTATESAVESGAVPGAEYKLPMMTAALFKITLTQNPKDAQGYTGVHMRWDGEYRGVGIGLKIGETISGVEQGDFNAEGNAFVAKLPSATQTAAARVRSAAAFLPACWGTTECAAKNGLNAATIEARTARATTSSGSQTTADETTMQFERVVIGYP